MTKAEYAEYEESVKEFFEREGINNLSAGYRNCPDCDVEFDDDNVCPKCGKEHGEFPLEPFISSRPCECCGDHLQGDREEASGYCPATGEIKWFTVCSDCIYYAEYHQLPDQTMLEIEKSVE